MTTDKAEKILRIVLSPIVMVISLVVVVGIAVKEWAEGIPQFFKD